MDFKKLAHDILDEIDKSDVSLSAVIEQIEKEVLTEGLINYRNRSQFALYIGINRTTLVERLKKYGLLSRFPSYGRGEKHSGRKTNYET